MTRCLNKKQPIFSKSSTERRHSSFYRKRDVFQSSPQSTKYLGYYCQRIVTKNFEKSPNLATLARWGYVPYSFYLWSFNVWRASRRWHTHFRHLPLPLTAPFGCCCCATVSGNNRGPFKKRFLNILTCKLTASRL